MELNIKSKNEIIELIYFDLLKYSSESVANIIYDSIKNNILPKFIILQIKNKNIKFLQLLWFIFKKYEYIRNIISSNMISFIISSFDDILVFFEIFKWFQEFGYNDKDISSNITIALYIQSVKYPLIKTQCILIINRINNKDAVHNRNIFFIHDEVDIITQYFTKDNNITNKMIIRCYQYDAINTLKKIQYKNKINFFEMEWFLLGPVTFNQHMKHMDKNPYEHENFSIAWIDYISISDHWDYLPTMITNISFIMWKRIINYFYMGKLSLIFVQVLLHQMKLNHIPYEKLKSNTLLFNNLSQYTPYLIAYNLYSLYSTEHNEKRKRVVTHTLSGNALETTVCSVPTMMIIFMEKDLNALNEIVFDSSTNLSKKYINELKYIDHLLVTDQLGWDEKIIKTYNNFKLIMQRIIDEANLSQDIVNMFNSFIPIVTNELPIYYQLRYANHILSMYSKLKISTFKVEFQSIYDTCMKFKLECIKDIRKETNTKLDLSTIFTLPENANIVDQFINLIENSDCIEYIYENINKFWIDELKDNKLIRNMVRNMLYKYYVPIQQITPILYNYYSEYATEEHFFLE
jgi:hypothetical protein